jgi:prolyl-tRNA editing enzyme YbaK/EbsC (Cys-tRNA(Pro) deacylase)
LFTPVLLIVGGGRAHLLSDGQVVLMDPQLAATAAVVLGSGRVRSKLRLPGELLVEVCGAEVVEGLTVVA